MQRRPTLAVLGFRPHTYWTAVVALAGDPSAPQVIERRRIVFANGHERFAYHQAAEVDAAKAEAFIEGIRTATAANVAHEIGNLIADLQRDGVNVRRAVAPTGTARLPETLEDILRAHARMHAAEGVFYRDVVAAGCTALGLQVHRVVERDLPRLVCDLVGVDEPALEARLKEIGASLGPPWSEDYRLATQAAWLHLDEP
ncbi:hypothetical protein [Phenylobacterium sp.]|uniref:hypothetical protein n=1 Tax=Phenylobacterium sp. TaxID=1871053 RepID=UPI0027329731|nr:hypothetical protein [Phenylobacterium sp.]MDP3854424.1 hypothetical protein [Phenylobacterium sp.]